MRAASERLAPFGARATVVRNNFCRLAGVCAGLGIERIDGVLLDLGVSSYQLDTPERGFSYMADAPLDMRMDGRGERTAYDVVNTYSEADLRRILFSYGEERFAGRIAARIVSARAAHPIETTGELSELIKAAIPAAAREGGHHPAKRSFQAIRIEVNGELDVIRPALEAATDLLNPGGRMAVITFHSLEDRIVKDTFAELARGCICPPDLPVCVCGRKPRVRPVSRKPILPSAEELEDNPPRPQCQAAGGGKTVKPAEGKRAFPDTPRRICRNTRSRFRRRGVDRHVIGNTKDPPAFPFREAGAAPVSCVRTN